METPVLGTYPCWVILSPFREFLPWADGRDPGSRRDNFSSRPSVGARMFCLVTSSCSYGTGGRAKIFEPSARRSAPLPLRSSCGRCAETCSPSSCIGTLRSTSLLCIAAAAVPALQPHAHGPYPGVPGSKTVLRLFMWTVPQEARLYSACSMLSWVTGLYSVSKSVLHAYGSCARQCTCFCHSTSEESFGYFGTFG